MDYIKDNAGNLFMVGGGALFLVAMFWEKISGEVSKWLPKSAPANDLDEHELVDELLRKCLARDDEEGAMLITAYGKHLYDNKMEDLKDEAK